jgi:hypothetical protein
LRAIAEQVDMLYGSFDSMASGISPSESRRSRNLALVSEQLDAWVGAALIDSTQEPVSGVRFAQAVEDLSSVIGKTVVEICGVADAQLRAHGLPPNLSLFELVLGASCTEWPPTGWKWRGDKHYLITDDLIGHFASANDIPEANRVRVQL